MSRFINLGSFVVSSGKIHVSDPCYCYQSDGAITLENALNGKYDATLILSDKRVAVSLSISHANYPWTEYSRRLRNKIAVDSGQDGFFDANFYAENQGGDYDDADSFYGRACRLTASEKHGGILYNQGVVSESGFGDGRYPLVIGKNSDGKIASATISFISDDDGTEEY